MAALAMGSASARAFVPYKLDAPATEKLSETAPGGAFENPHELTFDASGNLFVLQGGGAIEKFDSSNVFQAQFGAAPLNNGFATSIAVDDTTGNLYAGALAIEGSELTELIVLGPSGETLSQWTGANTPAKTFGTGSCCRLFTAVDNSTSPSKGDVYVVTSHGGGEVDVIEPLAGGGEGKFVRHLEVPEGFEFNGEEGIAVNDSSGPEAGQVYVVDQGHRVVDRFSAEGVFEEAHQIKGSSASEPFTEPVAVAVDGTTGDVFVVDHVRNVVDRFASSGEFLGQITGTAPNQPLQIPAGVAVQQTGVSAGEIYVAERGKEAVDVFALEVPAKPTVETEGLSALFSDSAIFDATVNPRGASTEYRFEYGPCATTTTCATSPYTLSIPAPDASLGEEDFTAHAVSSVHITGLTPSTIYHFRLVAHNSHGETAGEEHTFTTQPVGSAFELSDGRDWELVSPPNKQGASIEAPSTDGAVQAAADGSAVTYLASSPTEPELSSYTTGVQVLSSRGAGGWGSRDLVIAHATAPGAGDTAAPEHRFFTEDLSMAVVQPLGAFDAAVSPEASEQTPYLRDLRCSGSCFHPLVTGKPGYENVPAGTVFGEEQSCIEQPTGPVALECGPTFWAATPDAHSVIFSSTAPLTPGAGANELYEWHGGELILVSVLAPNESGEELPATERPLLGAHFGSAGGWARRAVSEDGSRVYWESGSALYMRDLAKHKTVEVDSAEPACLEESKCTSGGGHFQIASVDGSRVYFTDEHRLTKDAGAASGEPDLYECAIIETVGRPACNLTDVTPLVSGERGSVQGDVLGASEDGATVYFVADGALDSAANATHGTCRNGSAELGVPQESCGLYVRRLGGPTHLVAALSGPENDLWSSRSPQARLARVSPDGQWLAFESLASLTGYDNRDALSGHPDAEAYLYDANAGRVLCASCVPSGARPTGLEYGTLGSGQSDALPAVRGELPTDAWASALLPATTSLTAASEPAYQARYLSDSGRLFFNSVDALVPQDVNGTGDVYEWEPPGVGSCSTISPQFSARSGGCVGLISSGTSPEASAFLDASESGGDVFFLTKERLKPEDVDSLPDVYDAHECTTASPCAPTAPALPAVCVTEASCKAAPSPQPGIFGAPSSATFSGPGNLTPSPVKVRSAAQVRAERLAKALKACKKDKKGKRRACERQARKRYGAKKAKKSAQKINRRGK